MPRLFYYIFLLSFYGFSQNTLTVEVTNVSSDEGVICVALYRAKESFLDAHKAFKSTSTTSEKGTTKAIFENLPSDTYALAVFHDKNANKALDSNFFGFPKEPLGFSFGKLRTFGPPSFKECSFELQSDTEMSVPLAD